MPRRPNRPGAAGLRPPGRGGRRTEAAALGNVLVQARAHGDTGELLAGLRALVARTQPLSRYEPRGTTRAWRASGQRLGLGLGQTPVAVTAEE